MSPLWMLLLSPLLLASCATLTSELTKSTATQAPPAVVQPVIDYVRSTGFTCPEASTKVHAIVEYDRASGSAKGILRCS